MSRQVLVDLMEYWACYEAALEVEATIPRPVPAGFVPPITIGPLGYINGVRILLGRVRQQDGPSSGNDWLALARVRRESHRFQLEEFDSDEDYDEFRKTVAAVEEYCRWAQGRNPKKMNAAEFFLALADHIWDLRAVIVLVRKVAMRVQLTEAEARRLQGLDSDSVVLGTTLFEWEEMLRPPVVESRSHEWDHASMVMKRVGAHLLDNNPDLDQALSVRSWNDVLQMCRRLEEPLFEALATYGFSLDLPGVVPAKGAKQTSPMPLIFKGQSATLKATTKPPGPSA
jgi:hypothetical protein